MFDPSLNYKSEAWEDRLLDLISTFKWTTRRLEIQILAPELAEDNLFQKIPDTGHSSAGDHIFTLKFAIIGLLAGKECNQEGRKECRVEGEVLLQSSWQKVQKPPRGSKMF